MRKFENKYISVGQQKYTIEEYIGEGASCETYRVSYKENDDVIHYGILKEYCPAFLEESGKNVRDADGKLIIPSEYFEPFNAGLNDFKNTYKIINEYLSNNISAYNYHTVQMGLYECNNTAYTLTSCDYGRSYEKIEDKSLHMLLKIMLSVTKAVEMYHNAGFLHLDIKPKNILILDDVTDLIKLFDFDSLISIEKIKRRTIDRIPVPEDYYVPELNNRNLRNIGVSTDIFEIGAMMFERLFGFAPDENSLSSNVKYDFDSVKLLNGLSPKVKYEVEDLFKHTIRISPRERYKSTKELKTQLEKLISLTSDNAPYIMNMPKWQPSYFSIGRQDEIREVKNRLDSYGYIFIKAIGGIGKSELAKMFAEKYLSEYHTVQFCKYTGSLKSVVSSIEISGINNNDYSNAEELIREKNKIIHSGDSHTLLIVDNFNVAYDEYLREFLPSDKNGFKVIFTTRCEPANEYYSDKVFELSTLPENTALTLFYNHCSIQKTSQNDEIVNNILHTIQYNTLVLVLLAHAIKKTGNNLEDILDKLKNSELNNINGKVFHEYDFSSIDGQNYNNIFAHLNTIFNISNLTEIQKEILMNLSLVANIGIEIQYFVEYCESQYITYNEIDNLCSLGWIMKEDEELISLHSIVSDLIAANNSIKKKNSYYCLASYITDLCCSFDEVHIDILNMMFSYLFHLDKRLKGEVSLTIIDVKLYLAKTYFYLYDAKNATVKYKEAKGLIRKSFRFKPRYCFYYFGLAEIEENFGSPDKAIELYKEAINYFKKTINFFYQLCFDSLCGIASCYSKKHYYEKMYKYYIEAYHYTQNRGIKDGFKQIIFPSTKKDLTANIPALCDRIIEACIELEKYDEVKRFQEIKENTESRIFIELDSEEKAEFSQLNEITSHIDKAKELFNKSNTKDGVKELFKCLDYIKEEYGEESPAYNELLGDILPLLITANSNDGNISISALDNSFEFLKSKYGENSIRFAKYLILVAEVLSDAREIAFAEKYADKAKQICINLNEKHSFTYQEANLVLINALIIQSKIDRLHNVVDEIDYKMFNSKSDYEKLVKYAGMALLELKDYDNAIRLSKKLIEKPNVTPFIFCMACYIVAESYLEQEKFDEALIYLKKEKPVLDSLDDSWQKGEYLALYYYGYSWVKSLQGNNEEAISIIDECLENVCIDNKYVNHMMMCRGYIMKTQFYRNINDYKSGLDCISLVENYLKDDNTILKHKLEILDNLAVCYAANGYIEKGVKYFAELEKLFEQVFGCNCERTLLSTIYFADALIIGGSNEASRYLEKANEIVLDLNFQCSIYNAFLKNCIGVYLSDYEGNHKLARKNLEDAKVILEKIGGEDTPLYKRVLQNLDYLKDEMLNEIIREMAKNMIENSESNNEGDGNE